MINRLKNLWSGSLRWKLIFAVAGVHAVLMSLFVWDLTARQTEHMHNDQLAQAKVMAQSLAASSAGWLASRDVAGLQEIAEAQRRYPEMTFALLLDRQGLILAHTDRARIGQYVRDMPAKPELTVLGSTPELVDIAAPAILAGQHVGWVRVGLGNQLAAEQLARITRNGILYTLLAIASGILFASIMATGMTSRLQVIRRVSEDIEEGKRAERVPALGRDEIGKLGADFNSMLSALDAREKQLRHEIAERQKTEDTLRLHSAALEAAANMIFITDRDSVILWANPAVANHTGYTFKEMLGRKPREFFKSGRHDEAFYRHLWTTIMAGKVWRGEMINRRKDGSLYEEDVVITPLLDKEGEVTHFVSVKQDITERKAGVQALREGEERFRAIFEHSPLTIGISSLPEGSFLEVNEAAAQFFGFVREEIIGKTPGDLQIWSQEEDRQRYLGLLQRDGEVKGFDAQLRKKNGGTIQALIYGSIIQLAGRPYVLSTMFDITERKHAEAAAAERQRILQAVLDHAPFGIWMQNAAGRLMFVNRAFCESVGIPEARFLAVPHYAELYPAATAQSCMASDLAALAQAGPHTSTEVLTFVDGRMHDLEITKIRLTDGAGQATGLIGMAIDVTARRLAEEGKRQLEEQYLHAQRVEAIGTLASGLAHDLNNILTPMLMGASLLKRKLADPHDRDLLTLIEQSAQRGANIIGQLLTFSRGAEGVRGPIHLRHLLKEMAQMMQETFPKNISIEVDAPADLWNIMADATQIYQVLLNLCVNARDAMPDGGKLTVRGENVTLLPDDRRLQAPARPGRYLYLQVADTGHGIPPEIRLRIFDPFFTTKGIGKGSGLGLSTALGIAKGHQGFITVQSEPGQGSSFEIYLPASEEARPDGNGAATPDQLPRGNQELILVADDEKFILRAIRLTLEAQGYRVLTAESGDLAIRLFVQNQATVKLLVTDMMMPGMEGITLIDAVRAVKPGLPVIPMSGLEQDNWRERLATLGVQEFIPKPCEPARLIQAVHNALQSPSGGPAMGAPAANPG